MIYLERTAEPISKKARVETLNYKGLRQTFQGPSFIGQSFVDFDNKSSNSHRYSVLKPFRVSVVNPT